MLQLFDWDPSNALMSRVLPDETPQLNQEGREGNGRMVVPMLGRSQASTDVDLHGELFEKFAPKRISRIFSLFDFAPRKLPEPTEFVISVSQSQKHMPIDSGHPCHNFDDAAALIHWGPL